MLWPFYDRSIDHFLLLFQGLKMSILDSYLFHRAAGWPRYQSFKAALFLRFRKFFTKFCNAIRFNIFNGEILKKGVCDGCGKEIFVEKSYLKIDERLPMIHARCQGVVQFKFKN